MNRTIPPTETAKVQNAVNRLMALRGMPVPLLDEDGDWGSLSQEALDSIASVRAPTAPPQPQGGRVLTVIEGCEVRETPDGFEFTGFGRIDTDGSGPHHGDATAQDDTSFHHNGKPLNADVDRYVVIPSPLYFKAKVDPLGCRVDVTYEGVTLPAVCGDCGPENRAGEMSRRLAQDFGIDGDPNTGGVDTRSVHYRFYPGIRAEGYE